MKRTPWTLAAATAAVALASLTACAGAPTAEDFEKQDVTITIGNQPPASQEAELAYFTEKVDAFREAHPNWTIETSEATWDPATFAAQLAGGNLPTVFGVPFTDIGSLIERGQVADITSALETTGLSDQLNASTLEIAQDGEGHVFGIPTDAYALGLAYNRALFEEAGLDPNSPPTTWEEVQVAAKAITEATGKAGYSQLTKDNQGGWILTAQTYSFGGTMENAEGTEVTFDSAETREALDVIRTMRWEDDSMGSNFLLGAADLAQSFAAGEVGMFVIQSLAYQPIVEVFGMPAEDFGFTTLPTADGGDPVTLSGGNVEIVNAKATEAEKVAAVEWIDFYKLEKYRSEDAAIADAQLKVDQNTAVAIPGLSPVSDEQYETYLGWIADLNNVPTANFQPYLQRAASQTVIPEPKSDAQELYAALDPVVQAVLTDEGADVDALLGQAADAIQARLAR
ncbi:extracellular solute-binding protein [Salinibacterium soli]|uniref:Extracellular solute-binding protein n=1 Tax=Antiquaquibacter soli TaxID=3064523 RepID=A0ABT9BQZ4_9MICO|nr:extracellular solute-binding protein [Protaetiibacter sp. WY-16]MDO7883444.1 extracellular solute-binding protein [Protaetiibacter sp. WY-16]